MISLRQPQNSKRVFIFTLSLLIAALMCLSFWVVWNVFYNQRIYIPFYRKGIWLLVFVYFVLIYGFTHLYNGYKIDLYRITEIVYSQAVAIVFVNIITYLQIALIGRLFLNPLYMTLLTIYQLALAVLWAYFSNRLFFKVYPPMRMIMVYGSRNAAELNYKMAQRNDKFNIAHSIGSDTPLEVIIEEIQLYEAVVLSDVKSPLRNQILKKCFEQDKPIYLSPKISDVIIRGSKEVHVFDTPIFMISQGQISLESKIVKRFLDIVVSFTMIVLLSPVMLVVAAAIKLMDKGPILYRQNRLTLDGRIFEIFKFRSMKMDAEEDGVAQLAQENDDRITSVGRVLRRFRLDELPQLFNILLGDMSLVGPRPERPEIAQQYLEEMPEFNLRLKVKAGLTGYAQILGKYNTKPYDKLKLDLMYILNYSILLDLKLIMMTLKILFMPESTEGFQEEKIQKINEIFEKMEEDSHYED